MVFAELGEPLMKEVIACSTEQGRGSKPTLQVDKDDEECHLLQLFLLVPRDVRKLVHQKGQLHGVDGF